jgi:isopenicillin N synthase-like dioxygenase
VVGRSRRQLCPICKFAPTPSPRAPENIHRMTLLTESKSIPSLDLRRLDGAEPERGRFLTKLRAAAREVGFFFLIGHGIPEQLNVEVMRVARAFFALPEREKLSIEMANSPHFRGYTRLGWERTRGLPDWREQIDIGAERAALNPDPSLPAWRRLQGPNQWPAALPELRPVTLRWQAAATEVLLRLLQGFALALGQGANALEPLYREEPHQLLKLIRYPGREALGDTQGVGAHKDAELLTLLLQDSHGGLQVQPPGGAWIDVPPRPGALVVNVGEILELLSNGYLTATLHRAKSPPVGTERISVAFFLGARLDAIVPVLTLPPELARDARGVESDPRNPLLRQVGQNYLKGRLRSHPDVARRHYADVIAVGGSAR